MPDDESEEDDEDDTIDDAEVERLRALQKKKGVRGSISADNSRAASDWKAPFFAKTDKQLEQISAALSKSFMFASLPADNFKTVLGALSGPHYYAPGIEIIKEGDSVDSDSHGLFVIDSGYLNVYKKACAADPYPGKHVFSYEKQGQVFGELALLYNCARAATVIARSDVALWAIDRDTFNNCVKEGYRKMREDNEKFIGSVQLLQHITAEERDKVCDVLTLRTFMAGDVIIKEGDAGNEFFILKEGSAVASIGGQKVSEYEPGSYFGELALRTKAPRAATVHAQGAKPIVVGVLDGDAFRRMCVGKLEEEMHDRASRYLDTGSNGGYTTTPNVSPPGFIERLLMPFGLCCSVSKHGQAEDGMKPVRPPPG